MPFPWDEGDPQIRNRIQENLATAYPKIVQSGRLRDPFRLDVVKEWHRLFLDSVPLAEPLVAGGFRGSGPAGSELASYRVQVGGIEAVRPRQVRSQMRTLERRFVEQLGVLDRSVPAGVPPRGSEESVLDLCGWAHGEVVRVHPFADGNGRVARATAIWTVARYGLPVFINLRPRPDGTSGYAAAARASMTGRHVFMKVVLMDMLADYRAEHREP